MEQPDADRGDQDGDHRVAVAEHREEGAEGGLDQYPVGHVADAAAHPVAERGQEAGVVAVAFPRVGEHAGVQVRLALGKELEHAGEHEQHAGARDHPGDQRAQRAGGAGERARQGEDAGTDHAADDHRGEVEPGDLDIGCHGSLRCPARTGAGRGPCCFARLLWAHERSRARRRRFRPWMARPGAGSSPDCRTRESAISLYINYLCQQLEVMRAELATLDP